MTPPLTGSCHCGAVTWRLTDPPESATLCNCSICRRYSAVWAYGWLGHDIFIDGSGADARQSYVHGDREIAFHRCATCGCVTDWTSLVPDTDFTGDSDGPPGPRTRIAVNMRLADPAAVADISLRLFDGADAFADRPADGRRIRDVTV